MIKITSEGFYRLKKGAKTIEKVTFSGNNFFQGVQSKSFAEDKFEIFGIGASEGLYKLILNKNREIVRVEEVNKNPFFKKKEISLVRRVYMDPLYDFVWVGSDTEGLFRLNVNESIETGEIKQFSKVKSQIPFQQILFLVLLGCRMKKCGLELKVVEFVKW